MRTRKQTAHTVYLSGPMTGRVDYNYPAFDAAENGLILAGHLVINPARTGERDTNHLRTPEWHDYMASAISHMREATAIRFLPGWWRSYGAWVEFVVALKMRLTILRGA